MNRENWNLLSINECADVIGGGTPSTKNSDYWDGNIPWISPKDLSNNKDKYISNGERFITELGLEKSSAKLLPVNSLLFSSRAPIGFLAINTKPVATNQGFKSLILKDEFDVEFFYYLFKHKTEFIKSYASGSTFQEVSGSVIKNLSFLIPPKQEQEKISNILSKLDKKIELNQKMNETFEEIAKSLFKSWFIDFDPVRAKAEGRPTRLSKKVSDLFPDTFEESELGEIPEGWKVCELKEILDRLPVGKRYSNKNSLQEGKTPIIDQSIDGVIGYHNNDDFIEASSSIPVMTFANHTCNLRLVDFNFSTIQNVIPLTSKDLPILWTYIRSQGLQKFEEYRGHIPDFLIKKIHVPNKLLADNFESIVKPLYSKIFLNKKENKILTSLRDTLLPKLISGELKIPDAKNLIQEAGI